MAALEATGVAVRYVSGEPPMDLARDPDAVDLATGATDVDQVTEMQHTIASEGPMAGQDLREIFDVVHEESLMEGAVTSEDSGSDDQESMFVLGACEKPGTRKGSTVVRGQPSGARRGGHFFVDIVHCP